MPKKFFLCPSGERFPIKDCLDGKCSMGERCAPYSYLHLAAADREWKGKISTTQGINGTRMEYLKIRHDYAINPASRMFAVIGTRGHAGLERFANKFSLLEEKMEDENMTGIIDCLEEQPNGRIWLTDTKVIGAYKICKVLGISRVSIDVPVLDESGDPVLYKTGKRKGEVKTKKENIIERVEPDAYEYELQLNRYRIFAEEALQEEVEQMRLFVIPRDGGTWKADSYGIENRPYYVQLRRLDDKDVLDYFEYKKSALMTALENNVVPPPCTPREAWDGRRCEKYCDVFEQCRAFGDNPYIRDGSQDEDDE